MSDLWGPLPKMDHAKSPKRLLQEQAELLTERTEGTLRGTVRTDVEGDTISTELDVVAPFINNYTVTIVRITHGAMIYPALVYRQLREDDDHGEPWECMDYDGFEKALSRILQSPRVGSVLSSLLIQSKEA